LAADPPENEPAENIPVADKTVEIKPADNPSPEEIEQFEKRIRPLLAEHCYECHGAKKQEYGLRLDRRADFFNGGDDGPIFDSAEPVKSKLLKAIRHEGEIKMPPTSKLPEDAVAALTSWVNHGAPWPADDANNSAAAAKSAAEKHWAFQAVKQPPVPEVKQAAWVRTPIDAFILAKLEAAELSPSPAADPRALIRRIYYDVTGLPPSFDEVEAFARDPSPAAYERIVDQLLASPRYGERWGRYWLDLARYADTKGYVFTEDRAYHYAYTYRDWVIKSLNDDLPYDQFLIKQLAGDLQSDQRDAPNPDNAALGFLTLGRRFLNNKYDIIDDRIDVLMRTTQGLTVACARCHDHKFDPIPTADYYSLFGVFDASEERQLPIAESSAEFKAGVAEREQKVQAKIDAEKVKLLTKLRGNVGDYLLFARYGSSTSDRPALNNHLEKQELSKVAGERWKRHMVEGADKFHPLWTPWRELADLPEADFAAKTAPLFARYAANDNAEQKLHPRVAQLFAGSPPQSILEVAERYSQLFRDVDTAWQKLLADAKAESRDAPTLFPEPADEDLRQVLYGEKFPSVIPAEQLDRELTKPVRDEIKKLREVVGEYQASAAGPRQAHTLRDAEKPPATQPVLIRGNPGRFGPQVPRQFVSILSGPDRKPFANGSGRLELARAIGSEKNPLTARVIVNRVWQRHFGIGFVATPSDFGVRTAPPQHRELLDYLADDLTRHGWSLKRLHRLILLSNAYQQSSQDRPDCRAKDSENELFWKMNRRRLDLEAFRDSLLAASGNLDLAMEGPSIEMVSNATSRRRSVYGFVERQNLPGFFRTFDFASPDNHTPQRFTTTVPQQALFLLNSPFMVETSSALSRRKDVAENETLENKITALYRCVFGRDPRGEELELAKQFLGDTPVKPTEKAHHQRWQRLAQALLLTNEFAFVD